VYTSAGEQMVLTEEDKQRQAQERERLDHLGRVAVTRQRMKVAGLQVARHRSSSGSWPETLDEVLEATEDEYLKHCFFDAWGNPLELRILPNDSFAIICRGANGEVGGRDENADFVISERQIRRYLAIIRQRSSSRWGWGGGRSGSDWSAESLVRDIRRYKERHGELPDDLNDLTRGGPEGPIRRSLPEDNWGNPYIYVRHGDDQFNIVSLGADARPGGVRDNADTVFPRPGRSPDAQDDDFFFDEPIVRRVEARPDPDEQNNQLAEIARAQMESIHFALLEYEAEHGAFPDTLDAIAERLPEGRVPLDPWDNEFMYEVGEDGFRLVSFGSSGEEGGQGHAADVELTKDGFKEPEPEPESDNEAEAAYE
jgi:hypothetical protein